MWPQFWTPAQGANSRRLDLWDEQQVRFMSFVPRNINATAEMKSPQCFTWCLASTDFFAPRRQRISRRRVEDRPPWTLWGVVTWNNKKELYKDTADKQKICSSLPSPYGLAKFNLILLMLYYRPGPGARNNPGSFGRLWSENAGVPSLPSLVMFEGIRYLGPGEQSELDWSWRIPKLNIGALYFVGSCLEIPMGANGDRINTNNSNNITKPKDLSIPVSPGSAYFGPGLP